MRILLALIVALVAVAAHLFLVHHGDSSVEADAAR
jgi:hypothetical protein